MFFKLYARYFAISYNYILLWVFIIGALNVSFKNTNLTYIEPFAVRCGDAACSFFNHSSTFCSHESILFFFYNIRSRHCFDLTVEFKRSGNNRISWVEKIPDVCGFCRARLGKSPPLTCIIHKCVLYPSVYTYIYNCRYKLDIIHFLLFIFLFFYSVYHHVYTTLSRTPLRPLWIINEP